MSRLGLSEKPIFFRLQVLEVHSRRGGARDILWVAVRISKLKPETLKGGVQFVVQDFVTLRKLDPWAVEEKGSYAVKKHLASRPVYAPESDQLTVTFGTIFIHGAYQ
jgi:hypothetical protein